MKRIIFFCLAIFASFVTLAQEGEEEVYEYAKLRNLPGRDASLGIIGIPLVLDLNDYNMAFGAEGGLSLYLTNLINLEATYYYSYLDKLFENPGQFGNSAIVPAFESRTAREMKLLTRFYFTRKKYEDEELVRIKDVSSGTETIRYMLKVPADRLQLYGARIGYTRGVSYFYNEGEGTQGRYVSDGTEANTGSHPLNTFLQYGYASVGVSRTKISDLHVYIKNYGERKVSNIQEVYFDLLYAPHMEFENVYLGQWNGQGEYENYQEVSLNVPVSRLGIRAGYSFSNFEKFGVIYSAEAGIRPGLEPIDMIATRIYALLKVGMNFQIAFD